MGKLEEVERGTRLTLAHVELQGVHALKGMLSSSLQFVVYVPKEAHAGFWIREDRREVRLYAGWYAERDERPNVHIDKVIPRMTALEPGRTLSWDLGLPYAMEKIDAGYATDFLVRVAIASVAGQGARVGKAEMDAYLAASTLVKSNLLPPRAH